MSGLESQLKEKATVDESSLIHELKDKLNQQNTKFEELERENEDLLVLMGKGNGNKRERNILISFKGDQDLQIKKYKDRLRGLGQTVSDSEEEEE